MLWGLLGAIAQILITAIIVILVLKLAFGVLETPGRLKRTEDRLDKLEKEKK